MIPVLAIAWNLVRELARKRATAVFVLLVAGSALGLPYAFGRGAPLKERLELTITYGVGFPTFLVFVATIFIAAGLARDVESRRIRLLATKPAGTLRIVLGNLLGILLVDGALLLLVLAAFAASIARVGGGPAADDDARIALQRFFTARSSVPPEKVPPAAEAVKAWVDAAKEARGAIPNASEPELEARARRALRSSRLPPQGFADLTFRGLDRRASREGPGEEIILRFEVYSSSPREAPRVDLSWEALEGDGRALAAPAVRCVQVLQGVPQEAALPASSVDADGSLRLRARNLAPVDSGVTLILDPANVEVLPVYGRFGPNVARAFLLVLAELTLLASVVLAASCVFTSPTAMFLGLFLYLTALSSGFLRETFALYDPRETRSAAFAGRLERWTSAFGAAVLDALPDFATVDPVGRLASARAVTEADLARESSQTAGLKGSLALITGAWLLRRRELGK